MGLVSKICRTSNKAFCFSDLGCKVGKQKAKKKKRKEGKVSFLFSKIVVNEKMKNIGN